MSTTVSLTFTTLCCCSYTDQWMGTLCCCSYTDQWMGRDTHTSSSQKRYNAKNAVSSKYEWVSEWVALQSRCQQQFHSHSLPIAAAHTQINGWEGACTQAPVRKKAQFKESSSVKVHEWVSCLAVVDVNHSFTHIHYPLLLLIHRSMDGKGHAHQLRAEKGTM